MSKPVAVSIIFNNETIGLPTEDAAKCSMFDISMRETNNEFNPFRLCNYAFSLFGLEKTLLRNQINSLRLNEPFNIKIICRAFELTLIECRIVDKNCLHKYNGWRSFPTMVEWEDFEMNSIYK